MRLAFISSVIEEMVTLKEQAVSAAHRRFMATGDHTDAERWHITRGEMDALRPWAERAKRGTGKREK